MREVVVDLAQLLILAAVLDQVLAHRHQGRRAAGGEVEAAEQLLPRRLDGFQEILEMCRRGVLLVGLPGGSDLGEIRVEAAGEQVEEFDPVRHRRAVVEIEQLPRQSHARGLAAAGKEAAAEALQRLRQLGPALAAGPGRRAIDQGATALGNAAQKLLQEAHVHRRDSGCHGLEERMRQSTTNSSQTTTGATSVTIAP